MKKKHKLAFPNYTLSKEEVEWIETFERYAGFYPIRTDEVKDKKTFLKMIEINNEHVMDCAFDVTSVSRSASFRLSYYNDFI